MLVAINGTVYNSEDERISLMLYGNEQKDLLRVIANGHDIYNVVPKGTPQEDINENVKALIDVREALRD